MLEMLKEIRAKIASGWTTGVYARDANGDSVPSWSLDARCWCLVGACHTAKDDAGRSCLDFLAEVGGIDGPLSAWNDSHTKEEVLALIDKAIEHA